MENIREIIKGDLKNVKESWICLAKSLSQIWYKKLYLDWGYENFETYTIKELNLTMPEARKLTKGYYFLKDLRPEIVQDHKSYKIPEIDSVAMLRTAKKLVNKKISAEQFEKLEEQAIDNHDNVKKVRGSLKIFKEEYSGKTEEQKKKEERIKNIQKMIDDLSGVAHFLKGLDELRHAMKIEYLFEINDVLRKEIGGIR